jgi:hypothetical protein
LVKELVDRLEMANEVAEDLMAVAKIELEQGSGGVHKDEGGNNGSGPLK